MSADYRTFLKTLRRIPDDAILDMATRPVDLLSAFECIVARAVEAHNAMRANRHVVDTPLCGGVSLAKYGLFGGQREEWDAIDWAGDHEYSAIELAFVHRVDEAVRHAA